MSVARISYIEKCYDCGWWANFNDWTTRATDIVTLYYTCPSCSRSFSKTYTGLTAIVELRGDGIYFKEAEPDDLAMEAY